MLFLKDGYELGIVKEIGDQEVILIVNGEDMKVDLTEEEAEELQQYILKQENMLIPINVKTRELFLGVFETWNEETMDELVEASKEK